MMYVNYLDELAQFINLDQLIIPRQVFEHDEQLMIKNRKILPNNPSILTAITPISTTQFGASLQFIKDNNGGDPIPPIVRQCVEFLDTPDGNIFINMTLITMVFLHFTLPRDFLPRFLLETLKKFVSQLRKFIFIQTKF